MSSEMENESFMSSKDIINKLEQIRLFTPAELARTQSDDLSESPIMVMDRKIKQFISELKA